MTPRSTVLVSIVLAHCTLAGVALAGCSDPVAPADAPGSLDVPGVDAPLADTPGLDAPGLDAPGLDAPGLDAPGPADAPVATGSDPSVAGDLTVGAPIEDEVTAAGRTTPVTAYVPSGSARHPLVIFLPGFLLESAQYEGTLERIASHGFVVVSADPAGSLFAVSHVNMAADAAAVLAWALDPESPVASRIDGSSVAMAGHSLGGKLSTMVAAMDDRVTALLLLDPVNGGAGPLGYNASAPDIVPDRVTPLTIPIGLLGETNNATAEGFGMACAPAAANYTTFYDAATMSPAAIEWTLTGADHMDFLDDPACGFTCEQCPDGPGDDAAQLAISRTLSVAFLRRHLRGETAMDAWLTGSSVPSGVTVRDRP